MILTFTKIDKKIKDLLRPKRMFGVMVRLCGRVFFSITFFSIQRAYEKLKQNQVKFKYTQVIN